MPFTEKAPEHSFHLWLHETPVVYQALNAEQRTRWLNNLRAVISRTPLQTETRSFLFSFFFFLSSLSLSYSFFSKLSLFAENQLHRHLSSSSRSRLSFSLKRRSTSLTSNPLGKGPSSSSFEMKTSPSKASLREEKLEDLIRDPFGLEKFTAFLRMLVFSSLFLVIFSPQNLSFSFVQGVFGRKCQLLERV